MARMKDMHKNLSTKINDFKSSARPGEYLDYDKYLLSPKGASPKRSLMHNNDSNIKAKSEKKRSQRSAAPPAPPSAPRTPMRNSDPLPSALEDTSEGGPPFNTTRLTLASQCKSSIGLVVSRTCNVMMVVAVLPGSVAALHADIQVTIYVHIYICICMYVYTHICIYIYIYIYIYQV